MGETRLIIGTEVRCTDEARGRLRRIIVEPCPSMPISSGARLTHLAVGPDALSEGRLVPARLIGWADANGVMLSCSCAEFGRLEAATETSPEHSASWPYPQEGPGGRFPFGLEGVERDTGYGNRTTTRDRIPPGGVEIHRGEPVYAIDGEAGRMRGLIVDLPGGLVTGVLVESGHFPGRRGRIIVPADAVADFGDGVRLGISREQVHRLAQDEGA